MYRGVTISGHLELETLGDNTHDLPPASPRSSFSRERAGERDLSELLGDWRVNEEVRAEAAEIASHLVLRRRRSGGAHRGQTAARSARFDGNSDELDLDRTVELLAQGQPLGADDLWVMRPSRHRRSVALVADVSGSMDGDKARVTAATIGALAGELIDDELTIIAFWKDLAVLRTRASKIDPRPLLDELLRIEPRGLTNVHAALEQATRELNASSLESRCIVLLSDCVHNAGPDPRMAARRAPTTHVLLQETGEHDRPLAEGIARAGGGRLRVVRRLEDVAPGLTAILGN